MKEKQKKWVEKKRFKHIPQQSNTNSLFCCLLVQTIQQLACRAITIQLAKKLKNILAHSQVAINQLYLFLFCIAQRTVSQLASGQLKKVKVHKSGILNIFQYKAYCFVGFVAIPVASQLGINVLDVSLQLPSWRYFPVSLFNIILSQGQFVGAPALLGAKGAMAE